MIHKCEQFNTKEADKLQTTELSKIPKMIYAVKPKFPKNLEFSKIPKFQKYLER